MTFEKDWWLRVLATDPAYEDQVLPLLAGLIEPEPGELLLDLGCGEGRGMRLLAAHGCVAIGCDASPGLLREAVKSGPVVQAELPGLGWLASEVVDGAFAMLVLEHVVTVGELLREAARVVRPRGRLVVVRNHPLMTAPGSAPVVDPDDGEVLWRWGTYLQPGHTDEPQEGALVRFHHQPLADLLNAAAGAGWHLQQVRELPLDSNDPVLAAQKQVPRLIGLRWGKAPSS